MARKFISQKQQSNEEMFDAVVRNAIDFIGASLDDLNKRPKNGLVDFYTAIELFLKARLMKEHWTLIIAKQENANLNSFSVGDFHSVYLEDAAKRLKDVVGDPLPEKALDNFKALAEHRNQIVHFAHTRYADMGGAKAGVVVEQWNAWHYLHHLLTDRWKNIFEPYLQEIDQIHKRMVSEKDFIQARFKELEPNIQKVAKSGRLIVQCERCSMVSGAVTNSHKWGHDYECMVCDIRGTEITGTRALLTCDECGGEFEFFRKDVNSCPHCKQPVDTDKRIALCKEQYAEGDEWCDEDGEHAASCHSCQYAKPSVFFVDDLWSCVACFDRGWQAMSCPHCGEFVTGDTEAIKHFACFKCEDETRRKMFAGLG